MPLNKSLSETDVSPMGSTTTPPNYISTRNKRMREEDLPGEFSKFKEEMKELLTNFMKTQNAELKGITANLKDIQLTNSNIELSIINLTTQNEELRKKIDQLELQARKDRDYITVLEDKIEDLQRHTKKTCVEIKNVPRLTQESREDLINMVINLSKNVDLEMTARDIKDIFRLPGRKQSVNHTPIIVDLGSAILRSDLLKKAKSFNIKNKSKLQAKHLGLTKNEDVPVFLSEQLTSKGARLFFLARDLAKTKQYKYCWTAFGRVFVKQDDNSKIILIKTESQVHHLLQSA